MNLQRHLPTTCAFLVLAGLALGACGDDAEGATDSVATSVVADAAEIVEITMADFRYDGLPESVAAGTEIAVSNASQGELHEFVAFKLPDGDERAADEIMSGDPADLEAMLGSTQPAMVLLAPPGSVEQIVPVGEPVFGEVGRYLVLCAIPTGADPAAYLEAAATSDGPPQVEGGLPHFMQGMYAVVDVTA